MSVELLIMLCSVWGSQTRLDEREGEPIKAGWDGLRIENFRGLILEMKTSTVKW